LPNDADVERLPELCAAVHWRTIFKRTNFVDAQEAIARIYGIPLHMLQYPGGNTSYASVELLGIEWLRLGLGPMIARLEAAFQRIVPGAEQTFLKFTLDGLLRATTQERYNSYATALNNGFLNINEVRALEDRAPIDGGNQYWKPLNIGVVGQEPTE
jgi:HK97 family phage portal protein